MRLPATLGHEPYGTVIAAGPGAADVFIGEDRLVYPWTGCGVCARCNDGLDNFCMAPAMIGIQRAGGYADHLLVPHSRYLVDVSESTRFGRRHYPVRGLLPTLRCRNSIPSQTTNGWR